MKTLIATIAAAAALTAAAAPAAAQPAWRDGHSLMQRQDRIERQIERGLRSGDLSRREAARLQGDLRQVIRLEARYRVNGLSGWERADLDRRFDRLELRLRAERHDGDRYARGW
jgi:hypothetical protein